LWKRGGRDSSDGNSEWEEEVMGGTVEVEVEEENEVQGEEVSVDGRSVGSTGRRGVSSFGFLDKVEVDERETELDDKVVARMGKEE
jgi:hypothetical protein